MQIFESFLLKGIILPATSKMAAILSMPSIAMRCFDRIDSIQLECLISRNILEGRAATFFMVTLAIEAQLIGIGPDLRCCVMAYISCCSVSTISISMKSLA